MKQYTIFYVVACIAVIALHPLSGMEMVTHNDNFLKDKLDDKKKWSLDDWKKYYFSLKDAQQISLSHLEKQKVKIILRETKKKITIKETQLDLIEVTARIRETGSTNRDDLYAYKNTIWKYIELLPESYPIKKDYHQRFYFATKRIGILTEIDKYTAADYNYDALNIDELEFLAQRLPKLQKMLNKPDVPQHGLLDEKIELVEGLIKEYNYHDCLKSS